MKSRDVVHVLSAVMAAAAAAAGAIMMSSEVTNPDLNCANWSRKPGGEGRGL